MNAISVGDEGRARRPDNAEYGTAAIFGLNLIETIRLGTQPTLPFMGAKNVRMRSRSRIHIGEVNEEL
jgi:hypothetical protein